MSATPKKHYLFTTMLFIIIIAMVVYTILLFLPKHHTQPYRLVVNKGQGISAVSRKLIADNQIYNRWVLVSAAYLVGKHNTLVAGSYQLPANVSTWDIITRLKQDLPDTISVQIIEGMNFAQMRNIINKTDGIEHITQNLSDEELLKQIAPNAPSQKPEGLFFPSRYQIDSGSTDLAIFQAAYQTMQKELNKAWNNRQANLPYNTPYELLIMASLIEKETAHAEDRHDVAAVFRNRLAINMRLQTDPTVIYGMGEAYKGKIRRSDLRQDTPYNTYTRHGLPPTPIALPSKAALEAAANPSDSKYLYFVSRMDGTGKSQFSHTLDEHNAAVRKYILKK